MTAFSSGRHFLSGIALYLGGPLSLRMLMQARDARKRRRLLLRNRHYKPLSIRQKRELLEIVRQDDWFE
ncbi:hypothetical protein JJB09_10625 [Rhizobium sp. KVB221]|uniref:Uncharacterized protein n=1 Tax=Rhizobium setariae TaxID=2801340 RepID=A0A936YN04_9HYPH|nr:hypothetical protein [Rhizobium setariae]MBL0372483.1 hypothetical protein [Rhizobium setariae]